MHGQSDRFGQMTWERAEHEAYSSKTPCSPVRTIAMLGSSNNIEGFTSVDSCHGQVHGQD